MERSNTIAGPSSELERRVRFAQKQWKVHQRGLLFQISGMLAGPVYVANYFR